MRIGGFGGFRLVNDHFDNQHEYHHDSDQREREYDIVNISVEKAAEKKYYKASHEVACDNRRDRFSVGQFDDRSHRRTRPHARERQRNRDEHEYAQHFFKVAFAPYFRRDFAVLVGFAHGLTFAFELLVNDFAEFVEKFGFRQPLDERYQH